MGRAWAEEACTGHLDRKEEGAEQGAGGLGRRGEVGAEQGAVSGRAGLGVCQHQHWVSSWEVLRTPWIAAQGKTGQTCPQETQTCPRARTPIRKEREGSRAP